MFKIFIDYPRARHTPDGALYFIFLFTITNIWWSVIYVLALAKSLGDIGVGGGIVHSSGGFVWALDLCMADG